MNRSVEAMDPLTRELLYKGLVGVAEDMMVTVIRTSRSTIVKNSLDFSACICDANGNLVAQGLALPGHLGSTMPALKGCLDHFGDDIAPGDILLSNDPYAGAQHLNDLFMFKPVYDAAGERLGFLSLVVHHTDMGGRAPGGQATDSTEIYQEGLRIPPSKFHCGGRPNVTLYRLIEANVRVPDQVMADVRAQVAALETGERHFRQVVEDLGPATVRHGMMELIDHAERMTRASISALPDGEAEFTEWNDDCGLPSEPVKIRVTITVAGDTIAVDYAGTDAQTSGSINANIEWTASCTYAAIRTALDPSIPTNAGFYRPVRISAPQRSFVHTEHPAPVGSRGQVGYRVRSAVLGALALHLKGRVPACIGGSDYCFAMSGRRQDGRPFLCVETHVVTGHGGGPDRDGQDAGPYCLANAANVPVEVLESEFPLIVEEYGFLPGSEGPGCFRGALGIVRQYRFLADSVLTVRSDRQHVQPWGLFGGSSSTRPRLLLNPGAAGRELPSKFVQPFSEDQVLRVEMAGGGGYGNPFERDPGAVLDDVRQEKIGIAHAEAAYGVVVDPVAVEVDRPATARCRRRPAKSTCP